MNFEDIIYEKSDGIAKIIINRPDKYNACAPQTVYELTQALTQTHGLINPLEWLFSRVPETRPSAPGGINP